MAGLRLIRLALVCACLRNFQLLKHVAACCKAKIVEACFGQGRLEGPPGEAFHQITNGRHIERIAGARARGQGPGTGARGQGPGPGPGTGAWGPGPPDKIRPLFARPGPGPALQKSPNSFTHWAL